MQEQAVRKSDLSPARRRLVERMQRLRYGRIEQLVVRSGEPVIERGVTRVIRTVRCDGQNEPHPGAGQDDTILKSRIIALFRHLDAVGDGTVGVLHVGDGLPGTMEIEDCTDDEPGCVIGRIPPAVRPPTRAAAVEITERR